MLHSIALISSLSEIHFIMNKNQLLLAALWITSLAGTYWLAKDTHSSLEESSNETIVVTGGADQGKIARKWSQPSVDRTGTDGQLEEKLNGQEITSFGDALASALRNDDMLARNLQVAELLANLNAGNVQAALAAFQDSPRGYRSDDYFRLFMHAWAKIDPQAAVEYAFFTEDVRKVSYGGTIAMAEWGRQDPAAAKAYYDSIEGEERSKRSMLDGLVRGWADYDLKGASDFVQGMEQGREQGHFLELLAREFVQQRGLNEAMQWAENSSGSEEGIEFASNLVSRVVRETARRDPQEALAWMEQNMDSELLDKGAFRTLANRLADDDPLAAAAWVEKHLADERMDGEAISEVTREWAQKDPVAAAEWVAKFMEENEIRGDALITVSREWAQKDPKAALEWASGLEEDEVRKRSLASAVERWSREDIGAAGEWLNAVELTESHDSAVHVFAQVLSQENPETAFQWAQSIQDEELRERSTIEVARTWYRQDEETIKEWLPDSGLTEEQQKAVTNPSRRDWGRGGRGPGGGGRGPGGGRPQR